MFERILAKIKTHEDQEKILEEIGILLRGLYENKGSGFDSLLKVRVREWLSTELKNDFFREGADVEKILQMLKKEVESLESVHLTLSFEPTEDALSRFAELIEQALGKHILLTISYDPHIIGGVQIIYNGQFKDFSFQKMFEAEFSKSQDEILKVLHKDEV